MILYLVYDQLNHTFSHPLVGPDLRTVQTSLAEMAPENLADLHVYEICELKDLTDLFRLGLKYQKKVPDYVRSKTSLKNQKKYLQRRKTKTVQTKTKKPT